MSRIRAVAILFALVMAAFAAGRADELVRVAKLKTVLVPKKLSTPQMRPSECLQTNPQMFLWDGEERITPNAAGFVYVVEQKDGQRLLISDLNEGNRGWVSARNVGRTGQGRGVFFGPYQTTVPDNAFGYVMRGVQRLENDDLEHAAADFDDAVVSS